jgi:hypothetical protein
MVHCDKTHEREIKKQADGDYNADSCFGTFETVGVRPPWFNFHPSLLLALLVPPNANRIRLRIGDCDTESYPDLICGLVCLVGVSPCSCRYINYTIKPVVFAIAGHISELKVF